jgi:hypothetical protein
MKIDIKKNIKKAKPHMVVCMAVLFIAVLFLTGCIQLEKEDSMAKGVDTNEKSPVDLSKKISFDKVDTFEGTFKAIKEIDKKYQISFEQEGLFGVLVQKDLVPHILEDLERLKKTIDPRDSMDPEKIIEKDITKRTEKELSFLLVIARIKMVESQAAFHKGYSQGLKGLVGDGFYCNEEPIMQESMQAFNQSAQFAADANHYLDELLTNTETKTWQFIGIDEEKPLFYYSPLEVMHSQLRVNRLILYEYCHTKNRLKGRNPKTVFVNFEGTNHKDLFIKPVRVMPARLWRELTTPLRKSAGQRPVELVSE